jgi:predicted AAA+ superfamily ATPase
VDDDGKKITGAPPVMSTEGELVPDDTSFKDIYANETDKQRSVRVRESFDVLKQIVMATKAGHHQSVIVSGPPGIGKTHDVVEALETNPNGTRRSLNMDDMAFKMVKGVATPVALYCLLWNHSGRNDVIVFDDCDSALEDDQSLNLLKAALDTEGSRRISWLSQNAKLERDEIPTDFTFRGNIIFLTNLDFANPTSKKLGPHLRALASRSLYLDLDMHGTQDMLTRIGHVLDDGMREELELEPKQQNEVIGFVEKHIDEFRRVDLRTVLHAAKIRSVAGDDNWETTVAHTLFHKTAKHKYLAKRAGVKGVE